MTLDSTSFPERLTKIDALTRGDHTYLREEDKCFFLGEYTARGGFSHSATNNLIINFKKPMDRRGLPEWVHKRRNILKAACALYKAVRRTNLREYTFVPVPPSKARTDPMYDNRMMEMLTHLKTLVKKYQGYEIDVRELVSQPVNRAAAHDSDTRPTPSELSALYQVDSAKLAGVRRNLFICDDVITTGCHFRAMEQTLTEVLPSHVFYGIFLARRMPESIDFEDLD